MLEAYYEALGVSSLWGFSCLYIITGYWYCFALELFGCNLKSVKNKESFPVPLMAVSLLYALGFGEFHFLALVYHGGVDRLVAIYTSTLFVPLSLFLVGVVATLIQAVIAWVKRF